MEFSPPEAPLEEGYWRALVEGGEHGGKAAPPTPPEEVWRSLGLEEGNGPTDSSIFGSDGRWEEAIQAMETEAVLELPVVGYNRGGLLVEWNGHQGFVPASHLEGLSTYTDERERERELKARLGKTLRLRVIEVDPERSRLVLSERATRADEAKRQSLINQLRPGSVRKGRVTNLCSFGAFVDLGGVEGLVHVSEISWGRVDHPADLLQPGQEVEVFVLNVDQERGRIGLSIKRTRPDPWQTVDDRYHVGQIVEGTITNVVDFGAFVQVEEGVEGLIHVSEMREEEFLDPHVVVREGQQVRARVIEVNGAQHRLRLSLRDLPPSEEGTV
ncbi:MAG TPA: S1 RNA-binding domain-containing protein [Thermoflexia bacterium]|nr:S1 RNA-binding domain-containing protein [Thermoflexia bacterium]